MEVAVWFLSVECCLCCLGLIWGVCFGGGFTCCFFVLYVWVVCFELNFVVLVCVCLQVLRWIVWFGALWVFGLFLVDFVVFRCLVCWFTLFGFACLDYLLFSILKLCVLVVGLLLWFAWFDFLVVFSVVVIAGLFVVCWFVACRVLLDLTCCG